ncbi:hypothetical protein ACR9PT_05635 [Piscirickettsia salmonis]|uniref:hypothetical protein n=1 Tax=Piscirickettsia salmonis TaxID=1238 RepID=UPI003EB8C69C
MTSITLGMGRRKKVGGPLVKLLGSIKSKARGRRYIYITDCKTYALIDRLAPAVNVFSYAQAKLAGPCGQLDAKRDWYVYVEIKSGTKSEYSNAYKFPKDKAGHENAGDITKVKKLRYKALCDELSEAEDELKKLDKEADELMKKSRKIQKIWTWLADKYARWADEVTDSMVGKAEEIDSLKKEKKQFEKEFKKYFPKAVLKLKTARKSAVKKTTAKKQVAIKKSSAKRKAHSTKTRGS